MSRYIEGLASTYEVDLGGDMVMPGAWRRTLEHWARRRQSRPINLVDTHNYSSIRRVVGHLVDAKESPAGLWTRWAVLPAGDPDADAAFVRVQSGTITGMSIGYDAKRVRTPTPEERQRGVRRVLLELALSEVSLVQFPMCEGAVIARAIDGQKARDIQAERAAQIEERVRQARALARVHEVLQRRRSA